MGIGVCGRKYSFLKLPGKRHVSNMHWLCWKWQICSMREKDFVPVYMEPEMTWELQPSSSDTPNKQPFSVKRVEYPLRFRLDASSNTPGYMY